MDASSSDVRAAEEWLDSFAGAPPPPPIIPTSVEDVTPEPAAYPTVISGAEAAEAELDDEFRALDGSQRAQQRLRERRKQHGISNAPHIANNNAESLLSTHRLGKTGRHFHCAASLGPRGGPEAQAERRRDRERRRVKAEEAWSAVDMRRTRKRDVQTPGPGAHDVGEATAKKRVPSASFGPPRKPSSPKKQKKKKKRPKVREQEEEDPGPCEMCHARCWWGCDCECHEEASNDDEEEEAELVVEEEEEEDVVAPPSPQKQKATTTKAAPTKAAPPNWFCFFLGREASSEDFEVQVGDFDRAFRTALRDKKSTRDACRVLRRLVEMAESREQLELLVAATPLLRKRLASECGMTEDDIEGALMGLLDLDQCSSLALEKAIEATLLSPSVLAAKLKRHLDASKQRLSDVYHAALQKEDLVVFATNLAAEITRRVLTTSPVLLEYAQSRQISVLKKTAQQTECCAATCWWGCDCACHNNENMSSDEDEIMTDHHAPLIMMELGQGVEVRAVATDVYFPGVVACVHADGTFDMEYADSAFFEYRVSQDRLRDFFLQEDVVKEEERPLRRRRPRPPEPQQPHHIDAPTVKRTDLGLVAWRPPKPEKEVEVVVDDIGLVRASAVRKAEAAVARRRDRGVFAWTKTDRGLLPTEADKKQDEEEVPDTPASLRGLTRAHVPGFAMDPPRHKKPDDSDFDSEGEFSFLGDSGSSDEIGPGKYEPQWEATKPRPLGATFAAETRTELRPLAQLAMNRRKGIDGAPGEYDVERGLEKSRYPRAAPALAMEVPFSEKPRQRPLEVEVELAEAEKELRRRRRKTRRAERDRKEKGRVLDAKFRAWRESKLGDSFDESKAASSSEEQESSGSEGDATPASLSRLVRKRTAQAKFAPESSSKEATGNLLRRRAEEEYFEAARGPTAYDVQKSMAFIEPAVPAAATFGAELDARARRPKHAAHWKLAMKQATEQAAELARNRLLGPQLQHGWTTPDPDAEAAEYARFLRTSKAVFKYTEKPGTPELLKRKRLLELATAAAREDYYDPLEEEQEPKLVHLDRDPGRDVVEVLKKGLMRKSRFQDPARKSLKAPLSADYDAEGARRALLPEDRGAAAAFAAAQREELAGPFGERPTAYGDFEGEGDVLFLDPKELDEAQGFTFPKAAAESPVVQSGDEREGDILDIDLAARFSMAQGTAKGHRYTRFSKAEGRVEASLDFEKDEELWLSPGRARRFLEKSDAAPVFNKSLRFSEDDGFSPAPELVLSPKHEAIRPRTRTGVDFRRQSERWDNDDEILRNEFDEADARSSLWLENSREGAVKASQAQGHRIGEASAADFSKATARFNSPTEHEEGDILELRPAAARSQRAPLDWRRQSERFDDIDEHGEGDMLRLSPRLLEPTAPAPHLAASPKRAISPLRSKDGDRLMLHVSRSLTQKRLPNDKFDMSKAEAVERLEPQRAVNEDQTLKLSPKDVVTRPRVDKSVKFAALPKPAVTDLEQPRRVRKRRDRHPPKKPKAFDPYSGIIDRMAKVKLES